MLVSSYSARTIAPFQRGPQDAAHPTIEIVWVTSGRIAATVDGAPQCLDADCFSVIAPGTPHSSWTLDDEVTSHVLHLFASPRVALTSGVYPREGEVASVLRAFPPPTASRRELERAARALVDATRTLATPLGASVDERVLRVARSVAHDPAAPVTLAELARRARMSRHHFARSFRRDIGLAPMAYVRRLRAERAAVLLRVTDRSIAEIAFACGFSSAGRLSEAFRARFATSPTAWREEQRAERARQSP
ncbi:AraC family transcriptional regulator [Sandaracinus amylolyticus]|uniref:Transcriptional regulator, AraC family protein n=1 Tax=Sandaracinus amylolyticus TaxID=927083 RepID=A0A0F6SDE1_9BACT|nr:helix-turn-helix domain-containing protein [Sandaracinus amylolyticus]AKF03284.1 Transcriptional regulator, AraC family protein [Sandaracinus amylolyticus]